MAIGVRPGKKPGGQERNFQSPTREAENGVRKRMRRGGRQRQIFSPNPFLDFENVPSHRRPPGFDVFVKKGLPVCP